MGYFKITDGERLFLNVCCLVLVLEGNVETYKEERGMFYKPSKNVCSGLFLVNTFPEMYSFKKQWMALPSQTQKSLGSFLTAKE